MDSGHDLNSAKLAKFVQVRKTSHHLAFEIGLLIGRSLVNRRSRCDGHSPIALQNTRGGNS
jgi:hypothetical protein